MLFGRGRLYTGESFAEHDSFFVDVLLEEAVLYPELNGIHY
jgi:hypothetical protein